MYEPLTKNAFDTIFAAYRAHLDRPAAEAFEAISVRPFLVPVAERGAVRHAFWVVARHGEAFLAYDDHEDSFVAGRLDERGVLRTWQSAAAVDAKQLVSATSAFTDPRAAWNAA